MMALKEWSSGIFTSSMQNIILNKKWFYDMFEFFFHQLGRWEFIFNEKTTHFLAGN